MNDDTVSGSSAASAGEAQLAAPQVTHTIRLREAWSISTHAGTTHHTRKFGRPTTLDPTESIWLVCTHVAGPAQVVFNQKLLGTLVAPGVFTADITNWLELRNTVTFAVQVNGALGEVYLEFRAVQRAHGTSQQS